VLDASVAPEQLLEAALAALADLMGGGWEK
jgi:hypothetical protein